MWRKHQEEKLQCSFCKKSQDTVGKLISSPSDYPRAYICDECIAVCASIIEDDRSSSGHPVAETVSPEHPFLQNPLAGEFFAAVEDWMGCQSESLEAAEYLERMRAIAYRMIDFPNCDRVITTREPQ